MSSLNFWRRFKRIALFGLIGVLTVFSGWLNQLFTGDVYPYKSVDRTVGLEALERSQGVTTDGVSWIFSGKDVLVRASIDDDTILARNKNAIPDEFRTQFGSAHIGGISYANGCVYAAIEDSGKWQHPIVALFNGETLEFTGRYAELPGKDSSAENALTHGVPWVACDSVNGCFYVAQCDDADKLFAYDLETMEYARSIPLSAPIDEIQGAEMYNGRLYAATNDATRAVYRISLRTGKVEKYFDRILYQPKRIDNFGGEGEDITVLPMRDGTVFHALNIGALFVDANLRHYEPVQPDLPFEPLTDDDTPHQPPAVTYLDKFVLGILRSGSYTMETDVPQNGMSVPTTVYADGDNFSIKVRLGSALAQSIGLPSSATSLGDIRMITLNRTTDSKIYIAWTGGYVELNDDEEGLTELFRDGGVNLTEGIFSKDLEYYDTQVYGGYITELYRSKNSDEMIVFYFDSNGLIKTETIDLAGNEIVQTIFVRLTAGVSDPDAFAVRGRRFTMEELETLLALA